MPLVRLRGWTILGLLPFLVTTSDVTAEPPLPWRGTVSPESKIQDPTLRELSGLVASRAHPGVLWGHNDSGNASVLYALRPDGTVIRTFPLGGGLKLLDWEDIALDENGRLFLGDIGNNGAVLPLRVIHIVEEPDPFRAAPASSAVHVRSVWFRYPTGRHDAEGFLLVDGSAWIFTKSPSGQAAEVHQLPLQRAAPVWMPLTTRKLGVLPDCREPITAADRSRDAQGRYLAVTTTRTLRIYDMLPTLPTPTPAPAPKGGYRMDRPETWRLVMTMPLPDREIEAAAWVGVDPAELILGSEDRKLYRVTCSPAGGGRKPLRPR